MAKARNGKARAFSIPSSILDQLLDIADADKREAGIAGLAVAFGSKGMDAGKIRALLNERAEAAEYAEMLKGLDFSPEDILRSLPEEIQDVLAADATKRFVLTLRHVSDEDGERFVLVPSVQTARGRKGKTDESDDSDD